MTMQKMPKNINEELDSIFDFEDDEEKFEFEERVLNSDVMAFVFELMIKNNIKNKATLAKQLNVSKAYITKMFSGDKKFNVNFLVKLQRLFNMRFKLVDKNSRLNVNIIVLEINKGKTTSELYQTLIPSPSKNNLNEVNLKQFTN
jgi:hypothetical protein